MINKTKFILIINFRYKLLILLNLQTIKDLRKLKFIKENFYLDMNRLFIYKKNNDSLFLLDMTLKCQPKNNVTLM